MENAKHIVKRLFEEPWTGNFDAIDEFISPDYVGHDPAVPEPIRGPAGVRDEHREVHRGLPRRRDHGRRADRRGRQGRDPLDGSRNAHGRARRNLPDREGRHGLGAHDLALRGREGRRGVDDLGHARDARPAGRDPRARSRVALGSSNRDSSGRPAGGLPLCLCRVSEPGGEYVSPPIGDVELLHLPAHAVRRVRSLGARERARESRVRPRAAARVPALPAARGGRRLRRGAQRVSRLAAGALRAMARRARAATART